MKIQVIFNKDASNLIIEAKSYNIVHNYMWISEENGGEMYIPLFNIAFIRITETSPKEE